eukprot:4489503-Ditylum_brightwellii.AAC.1
MQAWKLGLNISCDEQTQGFQGKHLDDQYYRCSLDNLYMSAKFDKLALQCKIYVYGVTRKDGQGLPSCVLQEEVTSRTGQIAVQGT